MFPWQLLITGLVGVGGTGLGAWLNGRTQTKTLRLSLDAENQRARLAEKRRIYATFQASFDSAVLAINNLIDYGKGPDRDRYITGLNDARRNIASAFSQVWLIAPRSIGDMATNLMHALTARADAIEFGKDKAKSSLSRDELYRAMRADLGETH